MAFPDIVRKCRCGRAYTETEFKRLPLVGWQDDFAGSRFELRQCACGSSIARDEGADTEVEDEQEARCVGL